MQYANLQELHRLTNQYQQQAEDDSELIAVEQALEQIKAQVALAHKTLIACQEEYTALITLLNQHIAEITAESNPDPDPNPNPK